MRVHFGRWSAHPIDMPVTLLAGRGDGMSVKEHVVPA